MTEVILIREELISNKISYLLFHQKHDDPYHSQVRNASSVIGNFGVKILSIVRQLNMSKYRWHTTVYLFAVCIFTHIQTALWRINSCLRVAIFWHSKLFKNVLFCFIQVCNKRYSTFAYFFVHRFSVCTHVVVPASCIGEHKDNMLERRTVYEWKLKKYQYRIYNLLKINNSMAHIRHTNLTPIATLLASHNLQ